MILSSTEINIWGVYYIGQIFIINRIKFQYPVKIIHDYKERETMLTCLIVLEMG